MLDTVEAPAPFEVLPKEILTQQTLPKLNIMSYVYAASKTQLLFKLLFFVIFCLLAIILTTPTPPPLPPLRPSPTTRLHRAPRPSC